MCYGWLYKLTVAILCPLQLTQEDKLWRANTLLSGACLCFCAAIPIFMLALARTCQLSINVFFVSMNIIF